MGIGSVVSIIGGIRASALLVLCLTIGAVSWSRGRTIDRLESEAAANAAVVKAWQSANAINDATIESLQGANEAWRKRAQINEEAAQTARETLQTETAAAQAGLAQAHEKRRIIYRDKPNAHAWSTDAVPADVYAGMRAE